jgi:ADP-ribose pyrophosphatase YjhB (NUDIX family)
MPRYRPHIIGEVYLFLRHESRVLLSRRFQTGYEDGNYSVPAGHMEGNEEVRAALIREAREEIGIELTLDDLTVVGVVHSRSDSERVSFFVLVEQWRGEVRNMEPHKCDDLAWFAPNALPPNIVPLVRRALENFLAGRFYDSMGWDDPA